MTVKIYGFAFIYAFLLFCCLTKQKSYCSINSTLYFFHFIFEGVHVSTLPDHLLDQQPPIKELSDHARTAEWNRLGVNLELNDVKLRECRDDVSMYQLWIREKAREATRRNLLDALKAIGENNVASLYEDYLKKKLVSYTVCASLYIYLYN